MNLEAELKSSAEYGAESGGHLVQSFGVLQVLHADFEAIRVGDARPFDLRMFFLWHVQASKLVLWRRTKNKRSFDNGGGGRTLNHQNDVLTFICVVSKTRLSGSAWLLLRWSLGETESPEREQRGRW